MQCNANDHFMFFPSTHFQCLISSIQPVICWCTVKMIVLTYFDVFLSDSQYQWESSQVKSSDRCICIWNYVFGIWDDVFGISLITFFEITRGGCRPHRRRQSSRERRLRLKSLQVLCRQVFSSSSVFCFEKERSETKNKLSVSLVATGTGSHTHGIEKSRFYIFRCASISRIWCMLT